MLIEPIRRQDAGRALLRALLPLAEPATALAVRSTPWASVTFTGARHAMRLALHGADAAARAAQLAAILPEHEFDLRNHVVAELAAETAAGVDGNVEIAIEALTIEDA